MQARQDLLDRARRCWLPRSRYSTATASYRSPTARPYPSDTDTAFPWDQFGSLCGLWHLGQCTGEGGGACCRWPRRVNSIDSRRPDRIIWPAGWIGAIHTPRWANSSSRPGVGRWKMQCTMHRLFFWCHELRPSMPFLFNGSAAHTTLLSCCLVGLLLSLSSRLSLVLYAMYCATNMADVTLAKMFAFLVCNEYACSYQDNPSSMEWKFFLKKQSMDVSYVRLWSKVNPASCSR